jgi:CheY-like chemotaxis protein
MTFRSGTSLDASDSGTSNEEVSVEAIALVVDDSPHDRLLAGSLVEKNLGWKAVYAGDGSEALVAIERQMPCVVLTDLIMPGMDGLALVEAIRCHYPLLPVVLMTAHGSEEIAIQALRTGAASYVPKKSLARDLAATLAQVHAAACSDREYQRLLAYVTHQTTSFTLENDASLIPALIAHLQENLNRMKLFDGNDTMRVGIALTETLYNALFHGNLEVSSDLRQGRDLPYYQLAEERRSLPPYRDRRLHLDAELRRSEAVYIVRDEGPGFDLSTLPDPTDPVNLWRESGRGLLLIRTFMDEVTFNQSGNQITLVKRCRVEPLCRPLQSPPGKIA